jgi:hypothetical protein
MEFQEKQGAENKIEILEPEITREILVRRGREGLTTIPFSPSLVKNQEQFDRTVNDVDYIAQTHAKFGEDPLGVRETTIRQFEITVNGETISVKEADPLVVNKWISYEGMPAKLLSQEEARKYPYAGKTALDWATKEGKVPEKVVQAGGQFYPATNRDVIVPSKLPYRR